MITYLIPLTNIPQNFQITLNNVQYTLNVYWNDSDDAGWAMDILDLDGNSIACAIPFVTGVDLLAGLEYLGIDGSFFIYTDGNQFAVPTLDNIGVQSNLYFQTTAVVNA